MAVDRTLSIQLALLSPGWTRADITTPLRARSDSGSHANDVIVRRSQSFPANV